jgi:hypothetical protein
MLSVWPDNLAGERREEQNKNEKKMRERKKERKEERKKDDIQRRGKDIS